jgi:hypothetical protein
MSDVHTRSSTPASKVSFAVAKRADRRCQYDSGEIARFARAQMCARSAGHTGLLDITLRRITLGHNQDRVLDRYLW